jgi:ribosomal protein L37AE/L43A
MEPWLPFAIGALIGLPLGIRRLRRTINKDHQRQAGHHRCTYCNTRLKAFAGNYATTCRKCGRTQPWENDTPLSRPRTPRKRSDTPASFSPDFHRD